MGDKTFFCAFAMVKYSYIQIGKKRLTEKCREIRNGSVGQVDAVIGTANGFGTADQRFVQCR